MLTSNFELLVTRIANVMAPPPITAPFRKVVTGHFLTITNLAPNRSIHLYAKLTITTSVGNNTITTAPANVQFIFDNGSAVNNSVRSISLNNTNPNNTSFKTSVFTLGPRQTGLVAILPVINPAIVANPNLEIRGFVELLQARSPIGPFGLFDFRAVPPADVLFTPETRGTFLDDAYPSTDPTDELDFDQIGYALPIANGKARDTVEGLPGIFFEVADLSVERLKVLNPTLEQEEILGLLEGVKNLLDAQQVKDKK